VIRVLSKPIAAGEKSVFQKTKPQAKKIRDQSVSSVFYQNPIAAGE
jgi:hypothetical protein